MTYTATNPVNFRNKTGSLSDKLGTEFKNIQTEFEAVDAELIKVRDSNLNPAHKITRSATLVVAASDSSAKSKAQADYVCDGTADNVEIQAALDALPATGGEIHLLEGTYQLAATVARAIDNVTWSGSGKNTYIANNASTFLISFGSQSGWILRDIAMDYGGFDIADGKYWHIKNVYRNSRRYNQFVHIDDWSAEHIGSQAYNNLDTIIATHPLIKELDNFETGWTTTGDGASAVLDTTIFRKGASSIKLTTQVTATTSLIKIMSLPDMTNAGISFWIYTPDYTKINSIQVSLQFNGVWNLGTQYRDNTNYGCIPKVNNRWVKFNVPFFTTYGASSAENLTGIKIAVGPKADQQAVVYFNDLRYWKNKPLLPTGAVAFAFDDGIDSIYLKAKPKMDEYGYKGNWALILDRIKLNPLTIAWATRMQESGWDIINHSVSHDESKLVTEYWYQYSVPQKWLTDNGFKGARFVSYAFGAYNEKLLEFSDKNMAFGMTTMSGYNSIPEITHLLKVKSLSPGTLAAAKTYVDVAKANSGLLVFMVHDIVDANPIGAQSLVSEFNELIDYIASSGVPVYTYSQIAELIEKKNITTTGTGTISSGSTSVNIRHGFHKEPTSIQITPTSSLGSASSMWVSSKDTGTGNLFTVSTNVDPGQDVTFDWQATL